MPDSWAKALPPTIGLVGLDGKAGEVADQPAGGRDLLGLDPRAEVGELGRPSAQGHHDLLEGGVAGPLAEAIDRDLHLASTGLDRGQGIGRGQAQVVVAVDRHGRGAADSFDDPFDQPPELGRDGVADRVRDVDRRGSGRDDRLVDVEQVLEVRPRRVLGRELDLGIPAQLAPAVGHPADRLAKGLVAVDPELVLEVDVGGGDEDVQVGPLGGPDGLHGALRVAVLAARQGGYGHAPGLLGDAADRLEVARRGGRKAGLDHVDLEPDELAGDFELLGRGQARPGRLLAVAQGGVEDPDRAGLDPRARSRGGHRDAPADEPAPPTDAWAWPALTSIGLRKAIWLRSEAPTRSTR